MWETFAAESWLSWVGPLLMLMLYFARRLHRLWIAGRSGCGRFIPQNCVKFQQQAGFHSSDERNTSSVKLTNTFIGQLASHWELDLPSQSQGGGAQKMLLQPLTVPRSSDTEVREVVTVNCASCVMKEGQCLKWVAPVEAELEKLQLSTFFKW